MVTLVVSVTGAVGVSALCSLFEAVLYSTPWSHIESMVQRGSGAGRILKRLRREVDRPIAAILSLNTVAHTAGAAVAGAAAARVFGGEWLPHFSVAFTLTILMLSEVLPKTAGVVYNRRLAGPIARPLQLLVWTLAPLVWLCRSATRLVSRGHREDSISDEEIILLARLGVQTGTLDSREAEVIQNILALESKKAAQVMTPRTVTFALDARTTAEQARNEPRLRAHSRIPVYDTNPDDVVGIVHRRDVLGALADDRQHLTVGELAKPVHFVSDVAPLDGLLRRFIEGRQHLFVVVDEHGGVAGVITLEDVLEEILGAEIVDETDRVADLREIAHQRRARILSQREKKN